MRTVNRALLSFFCSILMTAAVTLSAPAQNASVNPAKSKILLDTDIGDDIDDAFALALALRSPEVELLGITTAWGDTHLRAQLTQRFLQENAAPPIPIAAGIPTKSFANLSQDRYAKAGPPFEAKLDAVNFLLDQARTLEHREVS